MIIWTQLKLNVGLIVELIGRAEDQQKLIFNALKNKNMSYTNKRQNMESISKNCRKK